MKEDLEIARQNDEQGTPQEEKTAGTCTEACRQERAQTGTKGCMGWGAGNNANEIGNMQMRVRLKTALTLPKELTLCFEITGVPFKDF